MKLVASKTGLQQAHRLLPLQVTRKFNSLRVAIAQIPDSKGRLKLPNYEAIPVAMRNSINNALEDVSYDQILQVNRHGQLGVLEECADVFNFLVVKAAHLSGAVETEGLSKFKSSIAVGVDALSEKSLHEVRVASMREVQLADVYNVESHFLLDDVERTRLRYLLAAYLGVINEYYTVVTNVYPNNRGIDISVLERVEDGLDRELKELDEKLGMEIDRRSLSTSGDFIKFVELVRGVVLDELRLKGFDFNDVLEFALVKAQGRAEYIFENRDRKYEELKLEMKALEKVLETSLLSRQRIVFGVNA